LKPEGAIKWAVPVSLNSEISGVRAGVCCGLWIYICNVRFCIALI